MQNTNFFVTAVEEADVVEICGALKGDLIDEALERSQEEVLMMRGPEQESSRTCGDSLNLGFSSSKGKPYNRHRNARVEKFYKKGELLRRGGFGSVYAGIRKSDGLSDLCTYCQEQGGVLNEDKASTVTRQLLGALQHCHDHGVMHRDVKPKNILIQTETQEIKLIYFGCGGPLIDSVFANSGWFQEQKFLAGPGTVWLVGVTLYEIVCGNLPFTIFSSRRMHQAQFPEGLSLEIKDFIGCYLRPHAEGRSTLDQLQLHPWHRQSC
ncbi:hypothetical protein AAFF_G00145950 [Aldrovandia affinis]|uniref:non-specific serine/threonine protein kinase n=1 Tax=Aldrovandia affinis TaxID=143900 RepID=A0AAD7T106_9TELE|nr:hypothetical protein AAFF_G00145950 [Aldrovandia affinis]